MCKFPPARTAAQPEQLDHARQQRRLQRQLGRVHEQRVAEPWRVMTWVWRTICAALIPIALREVPRALERFLLHLARQRTGYRERRVAAFYRSLMVAAG